MVKIIEPSATIEQDIDGMAMLRNIERAGRTCYKSEDKITDDSAIKFVKMILSRGHESVLEHEKVTVRVICDRGVTHEIVRHRIASYCLAGDTVLTAYRSEKAIGRSQKSWNIEQLYNWQSDPKRKGRLKLIRIRSVDKHGRICPGIIKRVVYSGKQETFKITCKSGRTIRATLKHRFKTPDGWRRLSELQIGDHVLSNGTEGQRCHKAFHIDPGVLTVFADEITNIEQYRIEDTYDIEMFENPHNFVANGIVVHNSQESTRYCNYTNDKFGKEITVIDIHPYVNEWLYREWLKSMEHCEQQYMKMIELGAPPQIARSVLPNSLKTEIVCTFNLREWRHFFRLRCNPAAHPQMREISIPLLDEFQKLIPIVFDDITSV